MDFAWLWRNEELSDFVLLIRPILLRHAQPAGADEPEGAANTGEGSKRGSKRRRTTGTPAAAAEAPPRRRDRAADAAGSSAQDAQQQVPGNQQNAEQPQPSNARLTRRQQQQQQEQAANTPQHNPPQQRQQQQDPLQQQQQQHATPNTRRSRRSSAAADQQQQHATGDLQEQADDAQQQQQPSQTGAALQQQQQQQQRGSRVTRASSRKKQRASDAGRAPSASAAAGGQGGAATASGSSGQQHDREGSEAPALPAAAAAAGGGSRASGRRQQHGASSSAAAAAASGGGTQQQQQQQQAQQQQPAQPQQQADAPPEIRIPVHAVVMAGFSEYFKALICSWSGNLNRTLTLDVGLDEGSAAELMVEFMYTGKLPADASPAELLKMVRLADQYQVTRFLAAASSSFEALSLASLSLPVVLEVFGLPQLMQDAPEMARVLSKARTKLLELYGDLERVWASESLREQFLALPLLAVRCLLASEATAVAAENTTLVALTGWVEGPAGRTTTPAQRKDLLGLVRLPYLTSSFIGDILHCVPWVRDALDSRQLINAFQFAVASESTRQRLASYEYGPSSATPHFRCPRPLSAVTRASFEWSIELSTIKRMVADAKLWGRVVELSSPLHYFAGFWWQLLFNVERTPTPPDAPPDVAAAVSSTVVEFVGVRCHANCGSHDYWPRVVRFKASIAALQTGFWEMDYAYMKAIEGPIVDGVGLGYPGFFALPGQALESEAAWSRFVRGGRVQLRCEVLDCE